MKNWFNKYTAMAFFLGFIIGPIGVIEGFGSYTHWRIERQDKENAIKTEWYREQAAEKAAQKELKENFLKKVEP